MVRFFLKDCYGGLELAILEVLNTLQTSTLSSSSTSLVFLVADASLLDMCPEPGLHGFGKSKLNSGIPSNQKMTGAWYNFSCTILNLMAKPGYYNTSAQPQLWNRESFRRAYLSHYEHVRSVVPPERLFNFNITDGWGPLCEFLGKEVSPPEAPFPHFNKSKHSDEMITLLGRTWRILVWNVVRNAVKVGLPALILGIGRGGTGKRLDGEDRGFS